MAKQKNADSVTNRHLYTRISYLHQAATYLASQSALPKQSHEDGASKDTKTQTTVAGKCRVEKDIARQFVTDLKAVSKKALIRPSPRMKQTMCKFCDALLFEGETCSTTVQNPSKGGKKPWADIMVIQCNNCGHCKRYPLGSVRQKRRPLRKSTEEESKANAENLEATGS